MLQIPHISRRVYPGTQFWRSGRISGRATSRPHVRRSGFEVSACCVQPSGAALGRAGVTLRGELSVQTLKHGVGTVIGTEPQDPAPGVFDHAPRLEHDFLHHRLHAPSLGRMAQWRVFANERVPERVNDFATPCFMNLRCRVVLFQSGSFARAVG